jgi:hypothetical protein
MPAAADWITLGEAADILAGSTRFRPETIGAWARSGRRSSSTAGVDGRRRGEVRALLAAPRRVRAEDVQPGLFEDLSS